MKALAYFFSALAIAAIPVSAHDELPDSSLVQPMGNPINIGSFTVTHAELVAEVLRLQAVSAQCRRLAEEGAAPAEIALMLEPPSYARYPESTYSAMGVLNCGGVEWRAATNLARKRCDAMSLGRPVGHLVFPSVTAPQSYLSAEHHDAYRITDGDKQLHGICISLSPVADIENSTN